MKEVKEMTIGELAAYVCTFLNSHGIRCILSGGACVSIYTDNKYQSNDLDFIDQTNSSRAQLKNLLKGIGFTEENRYFTNTETDFFIEFPSGPLAIGKEQIDKFEERSYETGKLYLLTATDSIKDRLAAFFHWDDRQSLEQAIMISEKNSFDIDEIQRWSEAEGQSEKFLRIKKNFVKS
jgi:hypothetical protein